MATIILNATLGSYLSSAIGFALIFPTLSPKSITIVLVVES
nr:MAG TPA: hypothetical protein [Caudoviricetes sp.]